MDGIDPGRERVQAFRRRAGTPNRIVLTKLPAASANPPDTRNFQIRDSSVNPGIGKCGNVCGDHVRRQNPLGKNVTNFTKSHDLNWARLAK